MARQLSYLIIGNGIAGVTGAEILRTYDTTSMITIVADDPFPAYYRPALKDYLGRKVKEEKLWARPSTFYQQQRVRFVPGRAMSINTAQHAVYLQNRQQLVYDKLLLANGAHPRQLNCPGLNLVGVSTLRSVSDYQRIVSRLASTERVVVCGSGTLALESAETLNRLGYQVTHVLRNSTLWSEVLDATASDLVLQEERRAGIDVRTQEEIREIVGNNGQVTGIVTTRGTHIPCELVLIAIGIEPNIDFVRFSGIVCGRGIHVDATMRTSVPDIYAAGDVLEVLDTTTGRPRVLGQWYPAIEQARIAAHSMLGQQHVATPVTFYNATFLHGLDFVGLGVTTHYADQRLQEVIAAPQPQNYRKVVLHNGIPVGAILLGNRKSGLALKRAIDHHVSITPIVDRLFADDFNLDDWLDGQQVPEGARFIAPVLATVNSSDIVHTDSGRDKSGPYEASPVHTNTTVLQAQRFQQLRSITDKMRLVPEQLRNTLPSTPSLVLLAQNAAPQIVSLTQRTRFMLGRDKQNDIYLDDSATSRKHAELVATADGFYIRDLGSSNGVIVNKQKIAEPRHLLHEDTIIVGNMLLYFSFPPAQKEQPMAGLIHRNDVQTPSKERIHFEIDMCIGCDRCMSACPLPMSSMVNIADLNAATVTDNIAEHVTRFTHECIMCGSCVPVCPVDNHRDLLMLSLKQRIGVSCEQPIALQQIASKLPAGWTPLQLLSRLREQALLRDKQSLSDNYLCHLFMASQLLMLPAGATVLREGEYGRDLYFLLDGQCSAFTTEAAGKELPLAVVQRGEYVGEYGMLTGQQHPATVRTQTPALLLQVPEQAMQRLTELVPQVRHFFDKLNSAHSLTAILKRMALFQGVSDAAIYALCEQAQVKMYDRNERLFAEDNRGIGRRPARETLHVLLEGFVKVARYKNRSTSSDNERIIAYRQGGDYFAGGLDLLGDSRAVTVTAINRTRVAEIPRQALLALFQRYPDVNQRFTIRLREYIESTVSTDSAVFEPGFLQQHPAPTTPPADPHAKVGLHSLVQDGVIEGTEVLVIDLDACIHCNECEEACARRHGQSRMNRKGMVIGNISIATACRQCQDPVCMLCSRAGIARLPDGEVYITESCIGCGICAERCPYGAISIVNVSDTIETPSSWQTFSNIFKHGIVKERKRKELPMANITSGGVRVAPGPLDTLPPRGGYEELRKKIAIKCDLCAGYSDQACVQSCPTGAAIRVKPTTFFGSTEDILQR